MRVDHALASPSPLIEMNTTPLIDVMLVLLVMLIITIPMQTHSIKLDLPQPCPTCPLPNALKNEIVIEPSGVIRWNETPLSQDQLRFVLRETQAMRPEPELHLRPAPEARYETVDQVLAIIKREHVGRFGFVGNEAYATY